MKNPIVRLMGVVVVVGAVAAAGCSRKPGSPGVAERTGAAVDRAAEKTVDVTTNLAAKTVEAAKATAAASKDVAGQVVEKTGEVMGDAGAAVEKTGENMQK